MNHKIFLIKGIKYLLPDNKNFIFLDTGGVYCDTIDSLECCIKGSRTYSFIYLTEDKTKFYFRTRGFISKRFKLKVDLNIVGVVSCNRQQVKNYCNILDILKNNN